MRPCGVRVVRYWVLDIGGRVGYGSRVDSPLTNGGRREAFRVWASYPLMDVGHRVGYGSRIGSIDSRIIE